MKRAILGVCAAVLIGCGGGGGSSDDLKKDDCAAIDTDTSLFDFSDYVGNSSRDPMTANDPLAVYQWHLFNFGQKSGSSRPAHTPREDINVTAVWSDLGITGSGVTIAIVDDGTDSSHPDLKNSINRALSRNYQNHKDVAADPSRSPACTPSGHGTATAGIAAAKGFNGVGVIGVAPNATIAGVNIGIECFPVYVSDTLNALKIGDISSNSWEYSDVGASETSEREAFWEEITKSREGKGRIYVFAAGNSRREHINSNYKSLANSFYTITVAALESNGQYTVYSSRGANLLISAYGGGTAADNKARIVTTDQRGCHTGFNSKSLMLHQLNACGEYTAVMNGTSAATPMIAGVAALMLEANPDLTWRDVRYILATTARKNDPTSGSWEAGAVCGGFAFSHDYGFGVVDAHSAVKKAQNHISLGALKTHTQFQSSLDITIPTSGSIERSFTIPSSGINKIEFIDVTIDMISSDRTKNKIELESPNGTKSILAESDYALPYYFYNNGYTFGTTRHLDESADGIWKIKITNDGSATNTLKGVSLTFYGRN